MDEVWKDIAFSNLPHELYPPANSLNRSPTSEAPFSGLILQDYVPGAFGEPPQPLLPALLALRQDHSASLATQLNRTAEQPSASAIAGIDRRQKRIIKNRESAGRSRARKQAYANELEMEIVQLAKENATLKKEQEEVTELNIYI
ncbi:ABSCISIC ACID-INSENSITIVE 5-like protein 6 [Platanthera guangdongensis]|uniref:ABSCISIC ACID-INSENSITIVE 5-like protein 6 n=1 Tax=Platanthera guangdongensis TaxID=2320717 RepID=A0ABR2LSU1_9ASPA